MPGTDEPHDPSRCGAKRGGGVRWQELFADLEGQFGAAAQAELDAEVADRSRREVGSVRLVDRLRAALGCALTLQVRGGGRVAGTLAAVGPDWLLVVEPTGPETLVAASAVLSVSGLVAQTAAPNATGAVEARLRLGYALRGLVRDRATVLVALVDGTTVTGTFDRVGADFAELAEHPPDELRRAGAVRGVRAIALSGLATVRRVTPSNP
jgi:hypothetical protein